MNNQAIFLEYLHEFDLYIIIFLIIVIIFLWNRWNTTKLHVSFFSEDIANFKEQAITLEQLKLNHLQKIQQLETENHHLKEAQNAYQATHKEAMLSAKASLFELGNHLSQQLLELHKKETAQTQEVSAQKLAVTQKQFATEFERLVTMIGALNRDVTNSKSTVDLIKQSLLSPSGAGQLAEITLENILKNSGLRYQLDFIMQHQIIGSAQQKLRPDAVVFLPGNNLMVIDAKASKFLVEESLGSDVAASNNLLKAMNQHLKTLVTKDYVENIITDYNLKGNDVQHVMMLMFLPTEYAVDKITNLDPEFIHKAWAQNIFPVGPTGLMNMLSFAKFQINDAMRSSNHNIIIEEVRKIIGSINILSDYAQKLGNNIHSIVSNYDKFSASFNRNFLPKVRNIQDLGIETTSKTKMTNLTRYHLVSAKTELLDAELLEDNFKEEPEEPQ